MSYIYSKKNQLIILFLSGDIEPGWPDQKFKNQKLISKYNFLQTSGHYVKMLASNALLGFCSLTYTLFQRYFTVKKNNTINISFSWYKKLLITTHMFSEKWFPISMNRKMFRQSLCQAFVKSWFISYNQDKYSSMDNQPPTKNDFFFSVFEMIMLLQFVLLDCHLQSYLRRSWDNSVFIRVIDNKLRSSEWIKTKNLSHFSWLAGCVTQKLPKINREKKDGAVLIYYGNGL
jgi:hypothetical protein